MSASVQQVADLKKNWSVFNVVSQGDRLLVAGRTDDARQVRVSPAAKAFIRGQRISKIVFCRRTRDADMQGAPPFGVINRQKVGRATHV